MTELKVCHLRCKTANKYLNVLERVEVVEKNEDDPLLFPDVLCIASVCQRKLRSEKKGGQKICKQNKVSQKNFNAKLKFPYQNYEIKIKIKTFQDCVKRPPCNLSKRKSKIPRPSSTSSKSLNLNQDRPSKVYFSSQFLIKLKL